MVHITRDGGKTWENITPAGLPESLIQSIEVSPHEKGTAYIAATRYKFNDFQSMSYKTTDYGKTWTNINTGIDKDDFVKVIREDKQKKGLLYAGSERGFYVSFDGGQEWNKFQLNLPVVPVTDIAIADNDLVISTAGRSFWILDDLSAVQQSMGNLKGLQLFEPKTTVKYEGFIPSWMDLPPGIGENPKTGVILDYYLPEKADSLPVKLEIFDSKGRNIRTFSNQKDENFKAFSGGPSPEPLLPSHKGINRFAWNFRGKTLLEIPNAFVYGDYSGHRVKPGKYKAVLHYNGGTSETEFEIVQDPNLKNVTDADWEGQQQFLERAAATLTEVHQSVNEIRKVKAQLVHLNGLLKDHEAHADLLESGNQLVKKIDDWEGKIVETRQSNFQDVINFPSQLNAQFFELRSAVDVHDPRLTAAVKARLSDLENEWKTYKLSLEEILEKDVVTFNEKFKGKNIPAVMKD